MDNQSHMDLLDVPVTEPDANERDDAHPHLCRVTLRPDRYVYLTPGEVQDHKTWGSLLEGPLEEGDIPPSTPAPKAPSTSTPSVPPKTEG